MVETLKSIRADLVFTSLDQTGDQYHIAGALALQDTTYVCLLYNGSQNPGSTANFFKFVGHKRFIPKPLPETEFDTNPARTIYNLLVKGPVFVKELADLKKDKKSFNAIVNYLGNGNLHDTERFLAFGNKEMDVRDEEDYFRVAGPQRATRLIADTFASKASKPNEYIEVYERIVSKLSLLSLTRGVKESMFDRFNLPQLPVEHPVVLLWSRYTGQHEGYGSRGDSDPAGQKRLLGTITALGWPVITIGHGPLYGDDIQSDHPLGEFYLNPPMKGEHRGAQISFFLALMEMYPGCLIQLGQKTGGMDAGALLGIPTLYIEDEDNPATTRMQYWVGKVPNYHRIEVEAPPSITGKAFKLAFHSKQEGARNEREFKKVNGGESLSYRHLNVIALLYRLQTHIHAITDGLLSRKKDADLYTLEDLKTEILQMQVDNGTLQKWESNANALTDKDLEAGNLVRGYSDTDMKKIEKELFSAWDKYRKGSEIVRVNAKGEAETGMYVQRKDMPNAMEKAKL